eukprot:4514967-Alexandrium_andersonii.AAC.1
MQCKLYQFIPMRRAAHPAQQSTGQARVKNGARLERGVPLKNPQPSARPVEASPQVMNAGDSARRNHRQD